MSRSITAPPSSALFNEALAPWQFGALLLQSPRLAQAPRGNGERVFVWPGFGAGNSSTSVLRGFLRYLGYRAQGWTLGNNNGDVLNMLDELKEQISQHKADEPVTLIGWSLGGYLAREVARDCPQQIKQVVTLGSPVVGGPKYTTVAQAFAQRGESLDEIERLVDARYDNPLTVPVTAIYSKADGVVSWQACIDERSDTVEHVEIFSSHIGLGFSPQAYQIIADRLATANNN